ncbi:dihydroneopterin aldolase [Rhizobium sp. LCM 4573]|uniref:dihydroneopterin aldolase n=1 Tax=Rhizobium sp. LCM 4573 TaxID=1848291 RepID=UPI0008D8D8F8|nr:dihydroneopterin aldolase [Rhizobium sp. LCM 4573]OHV81124.1 dihydroneopterin aldolase [Rhizobium sp. LCM 4573]
MTYTITLKNCSFFARHGALEQEEFLGQRFFVDVVMEVDADEALDTDDVAKTVHYGTAFQIVEKVVTTQRRKLIEALARDVALALCERFPQIRRTAITVRKPSVPIPGILDHAEVRVEHIP